LPAQWSGVIVVGFSTASAGGDWSGAERAAYDFKRAYEDLRKLTPQETRTIVTAICQAKEKERKQKGRIESRAEQGEVRIQQS